MAGIPISPTETLLALLFDGENASTNIIDSSSYARAFTVYGTAQLSTAIKKFGTAGLSLGLEDYIDTPHTADLGAVWAGDFTLQCFFRHSSLPASERSVFSQNVDFQVDYIGARFAVVPYDESITSGQLIFHAGYSITENIDAFTDIPITSIPVDTWVHLAVVQYSGVLTFYVDGQPCVNTWEANTYINAVMPSAPFRIGHCADVSAGDPFNLDSFHLDTYAMYTGAFTPPEYDQGNTVLVSLPSIEVQLFSGADMSETLPDIEVQMTSGANIALSLPAIYQSLISVDYNCILPEIQAALLAGSKLSVELPGIEVDITAIQAKLATMTCDLPSIEMLLRAGSQIACELPGIQILCESTVGIVATMNVVLPSIQAQADVKTGILAQLEVILPAIQALCTAYIGIHGTIQVSLPGISADIQSTSTIQCALASILPAIETLMTGKVGAIATIQVTLEAIQGLLWSDPILNDTFCVNLLKRELISKFTNYKFNSFAVINGVPLGSTNQGLFSLTGLTDNSTRIVSEFSTPNTDFMSFLLKKLYAFRLAGRFTGTVRLTATNGVTSWSKDINFTKGGIPDTGMEYFNNTTLGRYFTFTFTNVDGNAFVLNSIDLYTQFIEGR
ncbi:MAG: LamG domain-containing protein [Bacteroidetes bacterium]|nr:LamG domain-containing protein [Bacteroidota bacterium]